MEHLSENEQLQLRVDELESVLHQVRTWCEAYPIAAFPEPDWAAVHEALKEKGIALDCVSASNMRHVCTGVVKIIDFSGVLHE
jgi:hypothetical protein